MEMVLLEIIMVMLVEYLLMLCMKHGSWQSLGFGLGVKESL
jgi:hypothetical protein